MKIFGVVREWSTGVTTPLREQQIREFCADHYKAPPERIVRDVVPVRCPHRKRNQFRELLTAGALKKGDAIVAVRLDDICSSAVDCDQLVRELLAPGIHLHIIAVGEMTKPLAAREAAAFAELDHLRTRERAAEFHQKRRADGKHGSGTVPFGYVVKDGFLVEQPEQQTAISRMRELRSEGHSFRAIAARLIDEFGASPTAVAIQRIVENKRKLAGDVIRQRSQPKKTRFNPVQ